MSETASSPAVPLSGDPTGRSSRVPGKRADEVRELAAELFAGRGYAATTMSDIATALGVLPGSIYHHFESKEDIATEILRRLSADLDAVTATIATAAPADGPRARILELTEAVLALSERNRAGIRLHTSEPPSVTTQRLSQARRLRLGGLDRAWRLAVDDLAGDDPARLSSRGLLRFALHELTWTSVGSHATEFVRPPDLAAHARLISGLLLDGLATDPPNDAELDSSSALRAVDEVMATWPTEESDTSTPLSRDVRTRIVHAARREFALRGYDATTIRDIAETAGIQVGTLYRHVESKESLLGDVLTAFSAGLDQATHAALTTQECEVASLDALAKVFVHARRRFRLTSDAMRFAPARAGGAGPVSEFYRQTRSRMALLEEVLARGFANGSLRELAAPEIVAPQLRYAVWVPFQDFGRTSPARAHRFLRQTLLRGYLTQE